MKTSDFDYHLPPHLIAQTPLENRSESRLLMMNRGTGEVSHHQFSDIVDLLSPDDCLIVNNSRVMPARLINDRMEFLLLHRKADDVWETLVKPGNRAKVGAEFTFGDGLLVGTITEILPGGNRLVKFTYNGIWEELLNELGDMPLPPYITEKLEDKERYQTVYSKELGSAAAPTAGLHFTEELLERIKQKGVKFAEITLHVGIGTFRPVSVENVEEHDMHAEYYMLTQENADIINSTKGKIVAVGTTTVRTLETIAHAGMPLKESSGWTDIFIYPGFEFKIVDNMITNFHLPQSTLMMMISAFSNREKILNAYKTAVEEEYRFFSFGDAMYLVK